MGDDAGQIVISGLTKRFGGVTAVDGLTFSVAPGSVTGFLGPNGAGKPVTELWRSCRMAVGNRAWVGVPGESGFFGEHLCAAGPGTGPDRLKFLRPGG
jgi:ABC-type glutathione transport system ATPase component